MNWAKNRRLVFQLDWQGLYRSRFYVFWIIPIAVIAKVFQYSPFAPAKSFADYNNLLNNVMPSVERFVPGDSFNITAILAKGMNIFSLDTLLSWSAVTSVIIMFSLLIFLSRISYRFSSSPERLFVLISIGLIFLYVANLSKEFFQFYFFIMVAVVTLQKQLSPALRYMIILIMMLWWGWFFRSYFMLIGCIFIVLGIAFSKWIVRYGKITSLIAAIAGIAIFLLLLKTFFAGQYATIGSIRELENVQEYYANTDSIFPNLISYDGTILAVMGNMGLNLVRILFPFEIFDQIKLNYLPFIVYQLALVFVLVKSSVETFREHGDSVRKMAVLLMWSYLATSALFEFDYGSLLRHESAILPVLFVAVFENVGNVKRDANDSINPADICQGVLI
jgi:hypothetical protein